MFLKNPNVSWIFCCSILSRECRSCKQEKKNLFQLFLWPEARISPCAGGYLCPSCLGWWLDTGGVLECTLEIWTMKDGLGRGGRVCWDCTAAHFLALIGTMCYKAFYELAVNLWVYVSLWTCRNYKQAFRFPGFSVWLTSLVYFINWYFHIIKSPLLKQKTLATSIDSFTLKKNWMTGSKIIFEIHLLKRVHCLLQVRVGLFFQVKINRTRGKDLE